MKLNTLFEGFSKQIYSKSNESSDDDSALAAKSTKRLTKWENEKYRLLLDDSIIWQGHKLYRIQYKKDVIKIGLHLTEHVVKKDNLGGYIESLDNLSEKDACIIMDKAKVWGNAKVFDDARVFDDVQIYDNAQVYGDALVHGHAKVYGGAEVYGDACIYTYTQIYGNAKVYSGCLFNEKINSEYH